MSGILDDREKQIFAVTNDYPFYNSQIKASGKIVIIQ